MKNVMVLWMGAPEVCQTPGIENYLVGVNPSMCSCGCYTFHNQSNISGIGEDVFEGPISLITLDLTHKRVDNSRGKRRLLTGSNRAHTRGSHGDWRV